jgi:hypothetical protein
MQRTLTAAGALAVVAAYAIALPPAQALPLAKAQVSLQRGVELIAQKNREDEGRASTTRKSKRVGGKEDPKGDPKARAPRYGSRAPGTSVPLIARGAYLYSPSFNGAYTPPAGYSFNGYPVRYADEVAAARAECASLRRRAMSSGQRSAWDRYDACKEMDD